MPRRVKAKKAKPTKKQGRGRGRGDMIQTVRISIGGGKNNPSDIYKKESQAMGGLGNASTASYPSSPSYYRLVPPNQQYASTPPALSGQNQAVPNNLVSNTLINPMLGKQGIAQQPVPIREDVRERRESLMSQVYAKAGMRLLPTDPEPNRPYGATQSALAAGRPILSDPSLPRQKPAGRDNYVEPYDAERGAPDSGFFAQQAQAPPTDEEMEQVQAEVGDGKEEEEITIPSSAGYLSPDEINDMSKTKLQETARRFNLKIHTGHGGAKRNRTVSELKEMLNEQMAILYRKPSSSSSSSSGAF